LLKATVAEKFTALIAGAAEAGWPTNTSPTAAPASATPRTTLAILLITAFPFLDGSRRLEGVAQRHGATRPEVGNSYR
jgi:hypothetical protein